MAEPKKASLQIGGIEVSPASHVILVPWDDKDCAQEAANSFSKVLTKITGRVFMVLPDSRWKMNTGFHALGGEASKTQARIPIVIGASDIVMRQYDIKADFAKEKDNTIVVECVGPILFVLGKGKTGLKLACCWVLSEIFGYDLGTSKLRDTSAETIKVAEFRFTKTPQESLNADASLQEIQSCVREWPLTGNR